MYSIATKKMSCLALALALSACGGSGEDIINIPNPVPSEKPSSTPSAKPSPTPSAMPSAKPSPIPSTKPSSMPSATPSAKPTSIPSTTPPTGEQKTPKITEANVDTVVASVLRPLEEVESITNYVYRNALVVFESAISPTDGDINRVIVHNCGISGTASITPSFSDKTGTTVNPGDSIGFNFEQCQISDDRLFDTRVIILDGNFDLVFTKVSWSLIKLHRGFAGTKFEIPDNDAIDTPDYETRYAFKSLTVNDTQGTKYLDGDTTVKKVFDDFETRTFGSSLEFGFDDSLINHLILNEYDYTSSNSFGSPDLLTVSGTVYSTDLETRYTIRTNPALVEAEFEDGFTAGTISLIAAPSTLSAKFDESLDAHIELDSDGDGVIDFRDKGAQ